eukprot:TRINITY_DN66336_c6_g3_i1.p2 TRINITY_DN66336_c6_g3~~TRINITY_DN66336_c6_g3_i1.p2  ORF type:complete len:366 (-),score=190.48 TRINITY_DN66336_c6_g3_i1:54-1151(-)
MGLLEKIAAIEAEMARTQKNKATEGHLGMLKAKLARFRTQLIEGSQAGSSKPGEGFDVMKSGDARVAMIGFPSVGKSTLLSLLTKTESTAANYEFTTLTCIPGVIEYRDANIQLLDLPGIIEGAAKGKGRGRQVIAVARTSDMILMVLDASKAEVQKKLLIRELESVNIRINKKPPQITFKKKATGGVTFNTTVPLTRINEKTVKNILKFYKIHNAEVMFREDVGADEFIDVLEGNRKYMQCLFVVNKVDTISLDEVDRLAHQPHTVVIGANWKLNLDYMLERMWDTLALVRVFTKPRGQRPDFSEPVVLRRGATIRHVCHHIHRTFESNFKYAQVWGTSAQHQGQRVGLTHVVEDEDVVQLMSK